ncbi:hypothetical protein O3M35_008065 [Rhynocoris fuscipes]|uniref:Uncharacterized protein n=1 Tax=Rhynocoris fuscipes TaxID=488301 RepID=A0AAW1D690_9HEMI
MELMCSSEEESRGRFDDVAWLDFSQSAAAAGAEEEEELNEELSQTEGRESSKDMQRIVKVKRNDRYDVEKVGIGDGPGRTSTAADFMKPWAVQDGFEDDTLSEMAELWDPREVRMVTPVKC